MEGNRLICTTPGLRAARGGRLEPASGADRQPAGYGDGKETDVYRHRGLDDALAALAARLEPSQAALIADAPGRGDGKEN